MGRIRRIVKWVLVGRTDGIRARVRRRTCGEPSNEGSVPHGAREVSTPVSSFAEVCAERDLRDGEVAEFIVRGTPVALARVGGDFYALGNICPHAGGPIGDGELDGRLVRCPLHGWGFDLETGVCDIDPALSLQTWPCRVRAGRVEMEINPPS